MSNDEKNSPPVKTAQTAEVRTKRNFSIVWLIPLLAMVIGGWLAYKSIAEKGPLISINFETAEGLEAGKTKVRYKDVVVGQVEAIELSEQLDGVIVQVRMNKDAKPYLTDKSRFWVVRARISASEVADLGTLLSGAYIAIEPNREGKAAKHFTGLGKPPQIAADVPGQHFTLQAAVLGSVNIGSPVFYRQIKVGQVVDYQFAENNEAVDIKIFIHAPHHEQVNSATKFWNASGIDLKFDANGLEIDSQSLVSILLGGIAFETPVNLENKATVPENHIFTLYHNHEAAREQTYTAKNYYLMYFDQSVRGLTPGAPVELRGIKIGEVVDVKLILDVDQSAARIPILVMIEPERYELWANGKKIDYLKKRETISKAKVHAVNDELIANGLRAQLNTGNLLTGQLYIQLDFFPDAEPVELTFENDYPVFPTVPSAFGQIAEEFNKALKKISALPLEELSTNLNETIVTLKQTLEEYQGVAGNVNQQVLPKLDQTLTNLQTMVEGMRKSYGADSPINLKTQQALDELTTTIRSIRSVADQLDRNPRSLIFGREGSNR